jgi:hypothetical protein
MMQKWADMLDMYVDDGREGSDAARKPDTEAQQLEVT